MQPESFGMRFSRRWAGVAVLLVGGLLPGPARSWDVAPDAILAVDAPVNAPASDSGLLAAAVVKEAFDEGAKVLLICHYEYVGNVEVPPPWRIQFTIDSKPVGSVQAKIPSVISKTTSSQYFDPNPLSPGLKSKSSHSTYYANTKYSAQLEWKASGDGPRNLQCVLNPDKVPGESNSHNNITQATLTVKRFKPLAGGELPSVQLFNPPGGPTFVLATALQIPLKGKVVPKAVGGKKDPVEYAKASPFEERWHIEILSRGSGELGGFEAKLGEFSGLVTSLNFTTQLFGAWLQQRDAKPGKYAARAFLSQTANGATVTGPNSRVEFELKELQKANIGLQPVPSIQAAPRGSTFAVPPPPLPVGRGLPPVPRPAAPAVTRMPAQLTPNLSVPGPSLPAASRAPTQLLPNLPAVQQPAGAPLQPSAPAVTRTPVQVQPNLPAVRLPAEIQRR